MVRVYRRFSRLCTHCVKVYFTNNTPNARGQLFNIYLFFLQLSASNCETYVRGTREAVTARGIVNDETRRKQVKTEIYILEICILLSKTRFLLDNSLRVSTNYRAKRKRKLAAVFTKKIFRIRVQIIWYKYYRPIVQGRERYSKPRDLTCRLHECFTDVISRYEFTYYKKSWSTNNCRKLVIVTLE